MELSRICDIHILSNNCYKVKLDTVANVSVARQYKLNIKQWLTRTQY